ncbi:hypothetical protein BH23BAC1_BH23BAC1_42300 [soil metagenome]
MINLVEKFYAIIFSENYRSEEILYNHKLMVFSITLFILAIILFFMITFIVKNIQQISYEGIS